jgi:hypothetical protein
VNRQTKACWHGQSLKAEAFSPNIPHHNFSFSSAKRQVIGRH